MHRWMHRRYFHFNNAVLVDHLSQRFLCSGQRAAGKDKPVLSYGHRKRQL